MSIQPDELRKKLTPEVRERILRDNWHSHDARWFLKVSQELGFDVANRLNQITLKSMCKTDMKRILQATESREINTVEDFIVVVKIGADLYFPPPTLEFDIKAMDKESALITFTRCPTYEEVKKAGIVGLYQCTCWIRLESDLEACNLNGRATIQKSMMQGDSICEISLSSISPKSK